MERKVLNQLVETSTPREGLIHVDSHIAVMLRRPQCGRLIYYYYTNVAFDCERLELNQLFQVYETCEIPFLYSAIYGTDYGNEPTQILFVVPYPTHFYFTSLYQHI